ncbi:Myosin-IIIb [Oopsacas minuta]|uniref:non-specific serine/threonine protein kinase n=1 Tax=Oopsacas minuta TaxID=111878 RepID=A0AAV7JUD4_9METZ|nr:Myosin-IIIb [Oopsacas minuta]
MASWMNDSELMQELRRLENPVGKWELVERIGEGTYGEVYKARNCKSGEIQAVKVMDDVAEKEDDIRAELEVLKHHSLHPNIASFYGAYLKPGTGGEEQLWLVMEYCEGGSITDIAKSVQERGSCLEEDCVSFILREILQGLFYLHKSHIIHRDVKGQNVLLTRQAHVKLIDFGIAAKIAYTLDKRHSHLGTPFWMAPEVIACENQLDMDYDNRADVWSLGITAIELADSVTPYHGEHPARVLFRIPRDPSPTVRDTEKWSQKFLDFIARCLIKDYEKRPNVLELLADPFVDTNTDPRNIRRKLVQLLDQAQGPRLDDDDIFTLSSKGGSDTIKAYKPSIPAWEVHDLASLETIDEGIIVHYLQERYMRGDIYTYVGDVLISLNPFETLDIYNKRFQDHYINIPTTKDRPPHLFAIADVTYQSMLVNNKFQCTLISGESGSGKTEASNIFLQHLTRLGRASSKALEDKILKVNPVLEAFGNARTIINNNSSRFGKYIEVFFNSSGRVIGAEITQYLLEKSRIIHQPRRERSFHIFYYLLGYLRQENKLESFYFTPGEDHRYMRIGGTIVEYPKQYTVNSLNFNNIRHSLDIIGFTPREKTSIYSIIAAILHMGDIQIEIDMSSYDVTSHIVESTLVANPDEAKKAATLLKINTEQLIQVITTMGVVTRGEYLEIPNTLEQAMDIRDAISKALYGRLFSWIVKRINISIVPKVIPEDYLSIGILDIFGFENFKKNSLEQMNINIANEQLQYFFNQHIFALEQAEYAKEGINLNTFSFTNNQPILDMLLKKPVGLLALLDDESKFSSATDHSLITKFHSHYSRSKHYIRPKSNHPTFGIVHYAGKVSYSGIGFLQKNRDTLQSSAVTLLRESRDDLILELFSDKFIAGGSLLAEKTSTASKASRSRLKYFATGDSHKSGREGQGIPSGQPNPASLVRNQTVSTHFRNSLRELMVKIESAQPHFIRCIDPNGTKTPKLFLPHKVVEQLRYTGVLETCKIRKEGYSHRMLFEEFIERYKVLDLGYGQKVNRPFANCAQILETTRIRGYQLGRSKVFLKYYHVEELNEMVKRYKKYAITLQRFVRGFLARRLRDRIIWNTNNKASSVIGRCVRAWLFRIAFWRLVKSDYRKIVKLQALAKMELARIHYFKLKFESHRRARATKLLQSAIRIWLAKRHYSHLQEQIMLDSLTVLQAGVRGLIARKLVKEMVRQQSAAIVLQRAIRVVIEKRMRIEKEQNINRETVMVMRPGLVGSNNTNDLNVWIEKVIPVGDRALLESRKRKARSKGSLRHQLERGIMEEYNREQGAITIQRFYRGWQARRVTRPALLRAANEKRAVINFLTEMTNVSNKLVKKQLLLDDKKWHFTHVPPCEPSTTSLYTTISVQDSVRFFKTLEQSQQKIPRPHIAGSALHELPANNIDSNELKGARFNFTAMYANK